MGVDWLEMPVLLGTPDDSPSPPTRLLSREREEFTRAYRSPKDPTIREKFDTYRFADYKEKVIDLLMRVTTVSVRTQAIVEAMKAVARKR